MPVQWLLLKAEVLWCYCVAKAADHFGKEAGEKGEELKRTKESERGSQKS